VRNRDRIICAVERLVREHGPDAVTMDSVAAAAGVGKGTIFRRFGDRAGLMLSLLDERTRAFQDECISGEPPLGPGAEPIARLCAFGDRMLDLIACDGVLMRSADRSSFRLRHPVHAFYLAHVSMLVREANQALDAEWTADALLATLSPELCLHQMEELGMPLERLVAGWHALVGRLVA